MSPGSTQVCLLLPKHSECSTQPQKSNTYPIWIHGNCPTMHCNRISLVVNFRSGKNYLGAPRKQFSSTNELPGISLGENPSAGFNHASKGVSSTRENGVEECTRGIFVGCEKAFRARICSHFAIVTQSQLATPTTEMSCCHVLTSWRFLPGIVVHPTGRRPRKTAAASSRLLLLRTVQDKLFDSIQTLRTQF